MSHRNLFSSLPGVRVLSLLLLSLLASSVSAESGLVSRHNCIRKSIAGPGSDVFRHCYTKINDLDHYHYIDEGSLTGTPLVFMHGFPDLWYGWRNQIVYFRQQGYRVIVPSMRGYYGNETPNRDPKQYSLLPNSNDVAALLDYLNIPKAVVLGHDWGGALAWRFRLFHPTRVLGIVGVNTPYLPPDAAFIPLETMVAAHPPFAYQLYLVKPESSAELYQNAEKFFKAIFRTWEAKPIIDAGEWFGNSSIPANPYTLLSPTSMNFYINTFKKFGFIGPTNWYRARMMNFEDEKTLENPMQVIEQPSLMLTAQYDRILVPQMTDHMPAFFKNLTIEHLKNSDHWLLWEQPQAVNAAIHAFLKKHFSPIKASL